MKLLMQLLIKLFRMILINDYKINRLSFEKNNDILWWESYNHRDDFTLVPVTNIHFLRWVISRVIEKSCQYEKVLLYWIRKAKCTTSLNISTRINYNRVDRLLPYILTHDLDAQSILRKTFLTF